MVMNLESVRKTVTVAAKLLDSSLQGAYKARVREFVRGLRKRAWMGLELGLEKDLAGGLGSGFGRGLEVGLAMDIEGARVRGVRRGLIRECGNGL